MRLMIAWFWKTEAHTASYRSINTFKTEIYSEVLLQLVAGPFGAVQSHIIL